MADLPPSRGRKPSPEKRQAILAAALQLFGERGLETATTREIAQIADTTERTLFKHFGSKLGLFQAVIEEVSLETVRQQAYLRIYDPTPFTRSGFAQWHREFLADRVRASVAAPQSYQIVFRELFRDQAFRDRYAARWMAGVFIPMTVHIERLQRDGQIAGRQSPYALVSAFFSLNLGFLISRFVLMPGFAWNDEQQIDTIVELFLSACDGPSPPASST
jgi:AcrR family transcriptional regulator